jgi:hypothetical protein
VASASRISGTSTRHAQKLSMAGLVGIQHQTLLLFFESLMVSYGFYMNNYQSRRFGVRFCLQIDYRNEHKTFPL